MKQNLLILLLSLSLFNLSQAQDLSGDWQGVFYTPGSFNVYWPLSATLVQNATTLTGQTYQFIPGQEQYYAYTEIINGIISNNTGSFETKIGQVNPVPGTTYCGIRARFSYFPSEEKILVQTTSDCAGSGSVELYRLKLKSSDSFCAGQLVDLSITGKDVKWYADKERKKLLYQGNNFRPGITTTTTFYVTQTYYNTESPPVAVVININNISISSLKATPASCQNGQGSILAEAVGKSPIQYRLDNEGWQNSPNFDQLAPKSYSVTIQDAAGCQATKSIAINQQDTPTITNIKLSDPKCGQDNGEIIVDAIGGEGILSYSVDKLPFQSSNVFAKLKEGAYTIKVKDAKDCLASKVVSLIQQASPVIQTVQLKNAQCDLPNGSITISARGSGALSYSVKDSSYQVNGEFKALDAGNYTIVVKDVNGCKTTQVAILTQQSGPQINQIQTQPVNCGMNDGIIIITAKGKNLPLSYSIDQLPFADDFTFKGLSAKTYQVTVKDKLDCQVIQSVQLTSDCRNNIHLPTAFTPDGNGTNESFQVFFSFATLTVKSFSVFDRWGNLIHQDEVETQIVSGQSIWSGTVNGLNVQPGVYNYVLKVKFPNNELATFSNGLTVLK